MLLWRTQTLNSATACDIADLTSTSVITAILFHLNHTGSFRLHVDVTEITAAASFLWFDYSKIPQIILTFWKKSEAPVNLAVPHLSPKEQLFL